MSIESWPFHPLRMKLRPFIRTTARPGSAGVFMSSVSACQERSPQKLKRSLVIGLTDLPDVTACSPNGLTCTLSVDFCSPTWPHSVSYCLLLQRAARAVAGSQGHCRLVLCGGWRLHRLNWTLCNCRMPLILHCFTDWLLLTLLNTCTGFKKETVPQRSAVRLILKPILLQVCLTTMAAMERRWTQEI